MHKDNQNYYTLDFLRTKKLNSCIANNFSSEDNPTIENVLAILPEKLHKEFRKYSVPKNNTKFFLKYLRKHFDNFQHLDPMLHEQIKLYGKRNRYVASKPVLLTDAKVLLNPHFEDKKDNYLYFYHEYNNSVNWLSQTIMVCENEFYNTQLPIYKYVAEWCKDVLDNYMNSAFEDMNNAKLAYSYENELSERDKRVFYISDLLDYEIFEKNIEGHFKNGEDDAKIVAQKKIIAKKKAIKAKQIAKFKNNQISLDAFLNDILEMIDTNFDAYNEIKYSPGGFGEKPKINIPQIAYLWAYAELYVEFDNYTPTQVTPTIEMQILIENRKKQRAIERAIEQEKQAKEDALKAIQSSLPAKKDYLDYFNKINIEDKFIVGATITTHQAGKDFHAEKSIAGLFWQYLRAFKEDTYYLTDNAKIFQTKKELASLADFLDKMPIKDNSNNPQWFTQSSFSAQIEMLEFLKVYLEFLEKKLNPKTLIDLVNSNAKRLLERYYNNPSNGYVFEPRTTQETPANTPTQKPKKEKTTVRNAIVAYYLIDAGIFEYSKSAIKERFGIATYNKYAEYSNKRISEYLEITKSVAENELKEYPKAQKLALEDINKALLKLKH